MLYARSVPFVSHWELIAVVLVLLLLFGPKQIPRLARSLGSSIREVREVREVISLDPPAKPPRDPDATL